MEDFMRKKNLVLIAALAVWAVLAFGGCKSDGGGDDGPDYSVSKEISFPSFAAGKIIRNQVAGTSGAKIYYEYLTFNDGGTGGSYALYSYVKLNDATDKGISEWTKLETNPFAAEGESGALPEKFTYDAASGTLSVSVEGKAIKTFLFDGGTTKYVAAEIAAPAQGADKGTLFQAWNTADGTYTFKDGGTMEYASGGEAVSGGYENDGGAIRTDGGIPFCWTKRTDGGEQNLYYQAFSTSRDTVSEVGRSAAPADGSVTEFNTGRMMFARPGK